MAEVNLIKGSYSGKLGQTVGAKWKDKNVLRALTKPANPNTEAQQAVRNGFKDISSFVALFADQIRYKNALDTKGMSVRNAIMHINKEMIAGDDFDPETLLISKGGLQKPSSFAATKAENTNVINATWAKPTATNFSDKAQMIIVAVDAENQVVDVIEAKADAETASGTINFGDATNIVVYGYYLDKRGSNKVASISVAEKIS